MPTDRPTAVELLAAVRGHLAEHIAPLLEGQPAFHLRVAGNVLALVERTLEHGPEMDQAESARLAALLGHSGNLLQLNRELADRIAAGEMLDQDRDLLDHLKKTAADKLALVNPRYARPRGPAAGAEG